MPASPASSDLELEVSPPRKEAKQTKKSKKKSESASHKAKADNLLPGLDKDALRRHNALERQCAKAQKAAAAILLGESSTGGGHPTSPREAEVTINNSPLLNQTPTTPRSSYHSPGFLPFSPQRPQPEATFTPTAAGLRSQGGPVQTNQPDFQAMLSSALSSFLAASWQQASQPLPQTFMSQGVTQQQQLTSHRRQDNSSSEESDQAEEGPEDAEFSEDEGLMPDTPAFTGLFRPALFKSLLHKARLTTQLGLPGETKKADPTVAGPHDALFKSTIQQKDCIPCPQLFSDVIQNPWGQPAAMTTPSSLDKKLYCSAPELEELLALPTVDQPVAALSSPSMISTEALDGLKAEDKRLEGAFRKAHQGVAWAIRSATATSFFTRAALIWLKQMQGRLPTEDTRLQQDISKIIAATEYAADASLNSAKIFGLHCHC